MPDTSDIVVYLYRGLKCKDKSEENLLFCVRDYAGYVGLALPETVKVLRKPHKKPKLNVSGIHCSVSHSGEFWLCAVAARPVGLDVEQHRQDSSLERIARRFFHPNEYAYLKERGFAKTVFFPLWTAKESYVKFTGEGISDLYSSFSVIHEGKVSGENCGVTFRHLTFETGYSCCVCTETPGRVKLVYGKM